MKTAKQFLLKARELALAESSDLNKALWDLICYSPKIPVRLAQEELLNEAYKFEVIVEDSHFSKSDLTVKGFKWGGDKRKVLLTHGWGSKAIDFPELITALKNAGNEVIAFDAPGCGSSEGDLSNLLLFSAAVRAIINVAGMPDVVIGHSMGAAANVLALKESGIGVPVLISIAPMVNPKEHFINIMNNAGASPAAQERFFESFYRLFGTSLNVFEMKEMYKSVNAHTHLVIYSSEDKVAPVELTEEFLSCYPEIKSILIENTTHEKIVKNSKAIEAIISSIKSKF